MTKNFLFAVIFYFFLSVYSGAELVKNVDIKGNKRVSEETILLFGDIEIDKDYSNEELNQIVLKLYDTGFFSNVEINLKEKTLEIIVSENPIIQNIRINGIKAKKFTKQIYELLELREKNSFIQSRLEKDVDKVKAVLRNSGYYFVKVEVSISEEDNNTVNIIYDVDLGEKARITKINFIGDKKYKDSKLRNIIVSEEDQFWKFISNKRFLNKERIDLDKRLLENFYKNKGFYEAKVLTTNVYFDESKGFTLTFNIDSRNRYKVDKVNLLVDQNIDQKHFDSILPKLKKLEKEYYSPTKLQKVIKNIETLSAKKELQFIETSISETLKDKKLDIDIKITEGLKLFVERVNIFGNNITKDNVVRSELVIDEGDPFSELLLAKSINNIKSRNIFGKVQYSTKTGSSNDLRIIEIEVEEKATGEISAGAGIGSDGGSFAFGITENNFLGTGSQLTASLAVNETALRGEFSVVNPNYNFSGNSLIASVESTRITKMEEFGYDSTKTGFNLGTQFEQYEDVYIAPSISTYYETLDTSTTASKTLRKQDGTSLESDFVYSIIRDKRNQRFETTDGYRLAFQQSLPLMSETSSITNGINFRHYYSPNENLTLKTRFYGKTVNAISRTDDVKISKRVGIPSRYLIGFQTGKIGPVDGNDHIGGNHAASLDINATLPKLLPNSTNTDIALFINAGNVWGVDYRGSGNDDSNLIRSAFGVNANWYTPIGPLSFSLSQTLSKADTDSTESFRFNIGTTF